MGEGREFPLILGRDVAGKIEAVGSTVTLYKPGDEVYAATDYVNQVVILVTNDCMNRIFITS